MRENEKLSDEEFLETHAKITELIDVCGDVLQIENDGEHEHGKTINRGARRNSRQ
ncbi:MAG TPA: hypothetical protein VJW94_14615 [Candidatus Acidoferrum sp.]|nr:hypothetical protein [Candidatus Acidoferrum sp.]